MIEATVTPAEINVSIITEAHTISVDRQIAPIPDNYTPFSWNGEYLELL